MRRSAALRELGVVPSRLGLLDAALDASIGIARRPLRAVLTSVGTIVGVGAFVATMGVSTTLSQQVSGDFDALRATEVVVQDMAPSADDPGFPADASERLSRLNGVVEAGRVFFTEAVPVAPRPGVPAEDAEALTVVAADPGAVTAMAPTLVTGRLYDGFHAGRGEAVALLGRVVAERFGLTRLDNAPAVFINGSPVTVIGIIDDVERRPEVLRAVVIPLAAADRVLNARTGRGEVLISVQPGAAATIAGQAAMQLRPQDPARLLALAPPDPRSLRQSVEGRVQTLLLAVAGISLVVGAIGIANTTLVAVLERTGEIGLRRALGARGVHVAGQVVGESAALGALGGLVGASIGLLTVAALSLANGWTMVAHPALVVAGPLLGAATGTIAGLVPANRARRIQPVDALRR